MSEDIELKAAAVRLVADYDRGVAEHKARAKGAVTFAPDEFVEALRAALSPPLELEGEREAIARIIDPLAYELFDEVVRCQLLPQREAQAAFEACPNAPAAAKERTDIALAKADAILSRRSTLPVGSQGVMASVAESTDAPAFGAAEDGSRKAAAASDGGV